MMQGSEKDFTLVMGRSFLTMQPQYFPGFAFSWVGLISHRHFLPAILRIAQDEGTELYTKIMEAILSFIAEKLISPVVGLAVRELYRAVLRILLLLHHDFPEFLAENHVRLCASIPAYCIQMRNLVVSAYPASIPELPDPFSAGLKVDRLEEIRNEPRTHLDIEKYLAGADIKDALDNLLNSTDQSQTDVDAIRDAIFRSWEVEDEDSHSETYFDSLLLNAVVLYISTNALHAVNVKGQAFAANSPDAKLLGSLALALDPEGQYQYISAIVNQLRYPNSHTHYFSYALLHVFGSASPDQQALDVQQIITRVLLERLLVHRPHPWGLIITLLEIIKNPMYHFWDLPFVKAAPEVSHVVQ